MGKCIEKSARIDRLELDLTKKIFQLHGANANGEVGLDARLAPRDLVLLPEAF